jgi:hypothetical protein
MNDIIEKKDFNVNETKIIIFIFFALDIIKNVI